ncbi:hypothetical protein [Kouleothrix sp.]|uniref:hypothetical protein n=1 Tax=Kouleothrix sp. TaxID=2779161 RepID=UPI0039193DFB
MNQPPISVNVTMSVPAPDEQPLTITIIWRDRRKPARFQVDLDTRDELVKAWQATHSHARAGIGSSLQTGNFAPPDAVAFTAYATYPTAQQPDRMVMVRLYDVLMIA